MTPKEAYTNPCVIPDFMKVTKTLADVEKEKIIIETVCTHVGVSFNLVNSHARYRELVYARYLIARFLRRHTSYSLVRIGQILDGRDHSTIIVGDRALQDWIDTEDHTRKDFQAIDKLLRTML